MNIRTLVGLFMLSLSLPRLALADPDKAIYELQERCGHSAAAWFKEENGNGVTNTKEAQTLSSFRNHYNTRLNKCFVLLMATSVSHKRTATGQVSATTIQTLFDLNDNNDYGSFAQVESRVMSCYVQEKHCANMDEWQSLIKPYLEQ